MQRAGFDMTVSVNLSVASLTDVTFAERITQVVREEDLDPAHMVLEVTESLATGDLAATLENLSRLRIKGFGLSLDDYGTGYSSMQRLTRVPFTELKVDGAFVRAAPGDAHAHAMVESSLELGRKLKLDVVAEGVETRIEWDLLLTMGCPVAQGYHIGRPMEAAELLDWARARRKLYGGDSQPRQPLAIQRPSSTQWAGRAATLAVFARVDALDLVRPRRAARRRGQHLPAPGPAALPRGRALRDLPLVRPVHHDPRRHARAAPDADRAWAARSSSSGATHSARRSCAWLLGILRDRHGRLHVRRVRSEAHAAGRRDRARRATATTGRTSSATRDSCAARAASASSSAPLGMAMMAAALAWAGWATMSPMALKSTIFKAELQVSDLDRNHFATHSLTIARHPSETDERMMVRLLAFALNADERARIRPRLVVGG